MIHIHYRPYNRFLKERIADSGLDSHQGYLEFIRKDIIKPIQYESLYTPIKHSWRNNWALNTNKHCSVEPLLPKIQQYREYNFPSRSQSDIDKYSSSFLDTDNIAIRIPQIKKVDDRDSFLLKKAKYGAHTQTIEGWVPKTVDKTLSNKSSVGYNILSNEVSMSKVKAYILDNKINFKKKGVGEYGDLSKVYSTNFNKEYQNMSLNDAHLFHNYKGIFSHVYDVAHRNGNIIVPFRK